MQTYTAYGLEDVDPRGFVSLMDMYEINFIRFKKLAGDLETLNTQMTSRVFGCLDLHLTVIEQTRYTTTAALSYAFDDESGIVFEPDMRLRICHDAELIEVISGHLKHGRQRLNPVPADALRLKWRLNRFLYKWLGYCLYLGHRFEIDSASKTSNNLIKKLIPMTTL